MLCSKSTASIKRCLACFFIVLLVSKLLLIFSNTTTTQILFHYYPISIFAGIMATGILYLWNFQKRIIFNFIIFTILYTFIEYLKLLNGILLRPESFNGSFIIGVVLYCFISFLYYCTNLITLKNVQIVARYIIYFLYIIFLFPPLLIYGYYFISKRLLTEVIVLTLFQTNLSEISAYFSGSSFLLWIISIILIIAVNIIWIISIKKLQYTYHSPKVICIIGFVFLCVTSSLVPHKITQGLICTMIKDTYGTLQIFKDYGKAKELRIEKLESLNNLTILPNKGGIYILVIGESETRDHMYSYGYSIPTTPWLESVSKEHGLILFSHSYSNFVHTVPSLTYALTEKNQYNTMKLVDANSIMEIAKAAGYTTYWISNQQKYGAWDTPIAEIASTADYQVWLNENVGEGLNTFYYDEKLVQNIPNLDEIQNALIVIHLMGSHGTYKDRYPKSFEHFSNDISRLNEYNNSVLYTDYVLQKIYDKVHNHHNFKGIIYFSDHGEDPENNSYHEATKFTYQMSRIPLIMYFSNDFILNSFDIFQTLQQHKDCYWTNDLAYNMLVSILGIHGNPHPEPNLDITSPVYDRNISNTRTMHNQKLISDDPTLK